MNVNLHLICTTSTTERRGRRWVVSLERHIIETNVAYHPLWTLFRSTGSAVGRCGGHTAYAGDSSALSVVALVDIVTLQHQIYRYNPLRRGMRRLVKEFSRDSRVL
jgi:hypothetical protein